MRFRERISAGLPDGAREIVSARQPNVKVHRIRRGDDVRQAIDAFTGPIHYQALDGKLEDIDTAILATAGRPGFEAGVSRGRFEAFVNTDGDAPWLWEFHKGEEAIRLRPVALRSGRKEWLFRPSALAVVEDEALTWRDAFGPGIHLRVQVLASRIAKRVILDHPLDIDEDLRVVLAAETEGPDMQRKRIPTGVRIGKGLRLAPPRSFQAKGKPERGRLFIAQDAEALTLTHRVPREWLQQATYPVEIDTDIDENVSAGNDDCGIWDSGVGSCVGTEHFDKTDSIIWWGHDPFGWCNSAIGLRFQTVPLGEGHIIDTAYMELYAEISREDGGNSMVTAITGENEDAAAFDDRADYDARTKIGKVDWDYDSTTWESYAWHQTAEIKTTVQAVLDAGNFSYNDDMALYVADDGCNNYVECVAKTGEEGHPAKLHVEWSAGARDLEPIRDAYLDSELPTMNYGAVTTVICRFMEKNEKKNRGILTYDLSDVPLGDGGFGLADATKLTLDVSHVYDEAPCELQRIIAAWVEAQVTWIQKSTGNNWATPGGDYNTPVVPFDGPAGIGPLVIDGAALRTLIRDAIDNRADMLRVIVKVATESGEDSPGFIFASKDGIGEPPVLHVAWEAGVFGSASLSGEGTLTVVGAVVKSGAASLSGSGMLTAVAGKVKYGAAVLSGSGTLSVSGVAVVVGSAVLAGSGSVTAVGVGVFGGAAALTGAGSLAALGVVVKSGAAVLSGEGVLTAEGEVVVPGVGQPYHLRGMLVPGMAPGLRGVN